MSMSSFTDSDMVILADAKELETWLWSVRYATSALFIVLLPGRLYQLQQRPVSVSSNWRLYLKLVYPLFQGFSETREWHIILTPSSSGHNHFVLHPATCHRLCLYLGIRGRKSGSSSAASGRFTGPCYPLSFRAPEICKAIKPDPSLPLNFLSLRLGTAYSTFSAPS